MTIPVLHGLWRLCPLHQLIGKLDRPADFRKGSPLIESNYCVGANRHVSASQTESTLLPMLIAGLVTVVIGITIAALFV